MHSALYYPHASVNNLELVKSALLLWDRLEFIVPWQSYKGSYLDPLVERAIELIGEPHCPSESEKREAHSHIEDLVTRPLSSKYFLIEQHDGNDEYAMYGRKLLPETWALLSKFEMSSARHEKIHATRRATGLTLMSILADCCAGTTRARVTDEGAAYATLANVIGADSNVETLFETVHQLIHISLVVVDLRPIDLEALIGFRERERSRHGSDYTQLRHRYRERIEEYVRQLISVKGHASDAKEVEHIFQQDLEADVSNLKAELGYAKRDIALSKEILVSALAAVGTIAASAFGGTSFALDAMTLAGTPVTLGGLFCASNKYYAARRAILQKHPMAYLYSMQ